MSLLARSILRTLGLDDEPAPKPVLPVVRGMTAEDFARAHGANEAWLRQWQSLFGKRVKELYVETYGTEPPQIRQVINGGERLVHIYVYGRQRCMRKAWEAFEPARELTP